MLQKNKRNSAAIVEKLSIKELHEFKASLAILKQRIMTVPTLTGLHIEEQKTLMQVAVDLCKKLDGALEVLIIISYVPYVMLLSYYNV